ncbi:MAG: 2'-deoxycytidine 5'-triphosphate deaminase domain-containing protein [Candidatus Hodarchaeota archaeon]
MNEPWKDWIPGVLSKNQLKQLCEQGYIGNVDNWNSEDGPIDYSAIDLTLTGEGYRMVKGSVKPFGDRYKHLIEQQGLIERLPEDDAYELKRPTTYLFKLNERIELGNKGARIYGQATAKSTIGRMDVLARLIVDGMYHYEGFDPEGLDAGNGDLYLEITPMTFNVRVKAGISLSQLRLFRGRPADSEIRCEEVYEPLLHVDNSYEMDGSLSVNLQPTLISGNDVCAFWANPAKEDDEPIDLWEREQVVPCKYWKFLKSDEHSRIKVTKTNFYILRSKETISLPRDVAVYCRPSDETIGEMRIHYAGFVHPFFGRERADEQQGTPLTFEVRGHDVDVSLKDGEKMARLIFYRMSCPCVKKKKVVSYNDQTLQLSKIFTDWPDEIQVGEDGSVRKAEAAKK